MKKNYGLKADYIKIKKIANEEGERDMGIVIIILIVGGIIWYKQTIGSDNAKMVRELTRGKNSLQTDVITYF